MIYVLSKKCEFLKCSFKAEIWQGLLTMSTDQDLKWRKIEIQVSVIVVQEINLAGDQIIILVSS